MATVKVQSGDSLSKIAAANGVSLAALEAANPQYAGNYNLIQPGQTVNLPSSSSTASKTTTTQGGSYINQQTQQSYPIGTASPGYNAQGQPISSTNVFNNPTPYQTPQPTQTQQQSTQQPVKTSATSPQTTSNAQNNGSGASGSQTDSQTGSTTTTSQGMAYDPGLAAYGIPETLWNQMSPTQQTSVMIGYDTAKAQYAQNASALTVQDALAAAAKDPNIINKYADLANVTASDLQNNLTQIVQNAQITSQTQQAQMQQAQAGLEKTFGGQGTAYSSFRQGAQQQLNTQNQGIITSTASQIQQQLRSAGEGAEQLYGSNYSGLNNLNATYINPLTGQAQTIGYQPVGGLTGTAAQQQQADINAEAQQNINLATPASTTGIKS